MNRFRQPLQGCRTGPPGYIGWRNRFLVSFAVYKFGLSYGPLPVSKTLHGLCKKAKPFSKGPLVANKSSGSFEKQLWYDEKNNNQEEKGNCNSKKSLNLIELFM